MTDIERLATACLVVAGVCAVAASAYFGMGLVGRVILGGRPG